uniref:MSV199 domain-containing protein n=1 Tax=viral metagenome TaxID=1070528 RepID=A0A6C0HWA0_9ZZZZ
MSVDIVNLIESNPITKFTGDYHSKLIEKVKNNFTNYEQQIFLSSFYCYLKYHSTNDFIIDLDNVWHWLGFGQKVNAKRVLEKNFIINTDYKLLLCQSAKQTNVKGGHNKEIFMLNIKTFKKFCLKAETKKADEIHDYFIKLENILFEITKEECDELKLQLEQQKTEAQQIEDKTKKEYETKLEKQKILEREKILLNEYGTIGSIIYIVKVKTFENGQYIIKLGESRKGIKNRYTEHKSKYEECLLLDCFSVQNSKDFESFVHNHENIRTNKVNDLPGHETELELFLIGKNLSYQTLLNIINNNIKYFNNNDTNKLELEIEKLKIMLEMKTTNNDSILVQELQKTINNLSCKIDNLEKSTQDMINKFNSTQTKVVTGFNEPLPTLGPRLQKIHPETIELVKVYECVTELMKENQNVKRPSINKAITENTIYCGFRWLLVDRELDPNIIHQISPTKEINTQNGGYIAQINSEQTEIVNVFIDRKTAALSNGYLSSSALDTPVKNFTITKGFYYKLFDKCSSELQKNFIEKNGEPLLYKDGVGLFNSDNQLQQEFSCKYDVIRQLKISDKTLTKALDKNILYNNYYYKSMGSKVKWL